ncbi:MAG TPA: D-glycero-beta-D-manno-heptose-7-phosphate kinase [Syntrophobacteraceae bacterium]|nr:D-glycero-beta-D-manno-heptose-7-phosphate kinase [Syntrophobacteraceae bacterium]
MPLDRPTRDRLLEAVERFPKVRVLVVGDLILDVFIWGQVRRISPEAPVPVVEVKKETLLLGGAANVVHNLADLGGQVLVGGLIGEDSAGDQVCDLLRQLDIAIQGVIREPGRPTTIKTRVIAHHQQVVRFDREWRTTPQDASREAMMAYIRTVLPTVDGIIVSDYGKGMVDDVLMDNLRVLAADGKTPIIVDPKPNNASHYRHATLITPNNAEASIMAGIPIEDPESLLQAGEDLLERLNCKMVLVTRGEAGMALFQRGQAMTTIPTVARRVYDVTGAGDTVVSTITLALLAGLAPADAAILANIAAGIVVGEVGTATVTAPRLVQALQNGM